MNWLHYLVEANIYLGVFYLCYCLFLNNETHYLLGRAYLLFSCVVSFILPITQLSMLKPVEEINSAPMAYTQQTPLPQITIIEPVKIITTQDVLFYAYIIGATITLAVLAYRLYRLSLLTRKSQSRYANKYKLIQLTGDNTAFSFFNYLFIGTEVPQADTIIAHELVHIRQRHSADIMFVELLKVVSWFNPFIYLLQRSLRTLHEYIADEQTAARERDALTYSAFLLNNAYGLQGSPVAHSFFNYNLLKKRIIMLNQKRSGRLARLKYLAAVPLCVGMLCASTLVFSKNYAFIDLVPAKPVQAEIRIDEPVTKTVKYFKIMDKVKGITAYSDNLSFTDKGVKKTFLAKSTSAGEIAYIQKIMKLTVEIIDVDSQTKMPMAVWPDAKADTPKVKLLPPPPPPARPKKAPKISLSKPGKTPPPPPPIAIDAPKAPPQIEIMPPAAPKVVPAKPIKVKKAKPAAAPKISVAPVVKGDVKDVNITIDSPVVVTNTKISLKQLQNVKVVTNVKLKKVEVKALPVIKLNLKIDSTGTKKS